MLANLRSPALGPTNKTAVNEPGRKAGWLIAIASTVLAAASIFIVSSKGAIGFIQDWASFFWWLDYRHGMIRRGLVGQIFQTIFGKLTQRQLFVPLMTFDVVVITLLGLALVAPFGLVAMRTRGADRAVFLAFGIPLFVSQLWPTLTFTAGYLDPLLLVIAGAAALALRHGRRVPVAFVMIVGPAIHELFVFLIPFILVAGMKEAEVDDHRAVVALDAAPAHSSRWTFVALGALGLASALVVVLTSSPAAARLEFASMPLDEALKTTIVSTTMSQGLTEALARMLGFIAAEPGFTVFNLAFFLAPALCACAGLILWRPPEQRATVLLRIAAGLFPASAVLIAWDLSRLLVLTTFTAGALFMWTALERSALPPPERAQTRARVGAARAGLTFVMVAALLYGLYPFTYSYFGYRAYFQYFPPQALREAAYRSPAATAIEAVWGHQRDLFRDGGDITCRLYPLPEGRACGHLLKNGASVYGPYVTLPLGRYRLSLQISAPAACKNPIHIEVVDLRIRPVPLATTDLTSGGVSVTTLTFGVPLDVARRGDFQFRTVQVSGQECARLDRVVLDQISAS